MPGRGSDCPSLLAQLDIGAGGPITSCLHPSRSAGSLPARPVPGLAAGSFLLVHFPGQIVPLPAEPEFESASSLAETALLPAGAFSTTLALALDRMPGRFLAP